MVLLSYFLTFIDSLIYVRHFIISILFGLQKKPSETGMVD